MSAKRKIKTLFFFMGLFFKNFLNKKCFFFQVKLRRIPALIGTSNCHVILQLFFQSPRTPTQTATPRPGPPWLTQSTPPNQRTATPSMPPPTTHPHPTLDGGSTRRTRDRAREQERDRGAKECVGVIYLLSRFWSRVWKD